MFNQSKIFNTLFFDIETVASYPEYDMLPSKVASRDMALFEKKFLKDNVTEEDLHLLYKQNAGLYAEFSTIICISTGYFTFKEEETKSGKKKVLHKEIKSFYGDEDTMLQKFFAYVNKYFDKTKDACIGGYNIKEFDIPFLMKRAFTNGLIYENVKFPAVFDFYGKKPWEITGIIDVMDMFKFGSYKGISLDTVAHLIGCKSSKVYFDAHDIHDLYYMPFYNILGPNNPTKDAYYNRYEYQEKMSKIDEIMEPIIEYCEGDVVVTMDAAHYFSNLKYKN